MAASEAEAIRLALPPPMKAPPVPSATEFSRLPPMKFGAPAAGSNRKARRLFTFISSGWSSVVPRKLPFGLVPALPLTCQSVGVNKVILPGAVTTEMFSPSASSTTSRSVFRLLTTCSGARSAATSVPSMTDSPLTVLAPTCSASPATPASRATPACRA